MYFCSLQSVYGKLCEAAGWKLLKWLVYKLDHHQQTCVGILPSKTLKCFIYDAYSQRADDNCEKTDFYMWYVLQFFHIISGAKLL